MRTVPWEAVPLKLVEACHVRVVCDGCGQASAELCCKREQGLAAKQSAAPRFRSAGWHHDPGRHASARAESESERAGSGRWYCPACARQTHL